MEAGKVMTKAEFLRKKASEYVEANYARTIASLPERFRDSYRKNMIKRLLTTSKRFNKIEPGTEHLKPQWILEYNQSVYRPKSSRVPYP